MPKLLLEATLALIEELRAAYEEAKEAKQRGDLLGRLLDDAAQLLLELGEDGEVQEPPPPPEEPYEPQPDDPEPEEPELPPPAPDEETPPSVEKEPEPDPPPPVVPVPRPVVVADPISGLPIRSGFGQTLEVQKLEKLRGARAGAFAAWCNHSAFARTWAQLRGGPLGKPQAREGIFDRAGAGIYHTVNAQKLVHEKALRIWIVPLAPHAINNRGKIGRGPDGKKTVLWPNAGIWDKLADPDQRRNEVMVNWTDFGDRWGHYLQEMGMPSELQVLVLGWENTGWWYPWSIGPDCQSYLEVWALAVDSIRAGLRRSGLPGWEKVRFEFRYAGETKFVPWHPTQVVPSNEHASILGCSLHGGTKSFGTPEGWREEMMGTPAGKIGLEVVRQMAVGAGMKLGVDEWSVVRRPNQHNGHPPDPHPKAAMVNALRYLETNRHDVSHECYLQSYTFDLLEPGWPGRDGYLQWVRYARQRVQAELAAAKAATGGAA